MDQNEGCTMQDEPAGERLELPQCHWHVYRGVMFRVVESLIGGHVVECKPAPRRTRKRAQAAKSDNTTGGCDEQ